MKNNKIFIFPIILLLGFTFLTFLNIHGSSIGRYSQLGLSPPLDSNVKFFNVRPILSDDWLVQAPLLYGQLSNGMSIINNNIGDGQNMAIFFDQPVKHWITIFRPQNWLTFFIHQDYALASKWWFGAFLLIVSTYFMIYIFTNNYHISILSSLILYLTPIIQWMWFLNLPAQIIGYMFAGIIFYYQFLIEHHNKYVYLCLILSNYFFACFIFTLYPPFQVPIGLLGFCIMVCLTLVKYKKNTTNHLFKKLLLFLAFFSLINGGLLFKFYTEFKSELTIITNTIYPGNRISTGGDFTYSQLYRGIFSAPLLNERKAWLSSGSEWLPNQVRSAGFLFIGLFLIPICIIHFYFDVKNKKEIDILLSGLVIYNLVLLVWILVGIPSPLKEIMLLNRSPSQTSIIGLAVGEILLISRYISLSPEYFKFFNKIIFALCTVIFISCLLIGLEVRHNLPLLIPNQYEITLISTIAGILFYLLSIKKKIALFLILFLFATYSLPIHPVYKGVDALIHSDLSQSLRELSALNPTKKWVVFNNLELEGILMANSIPSLSGVYLYPQFSLMKKFDPQESYRSIWNRYAHIMFAASSGNEIRFTLNTPDSFYISMDPCNPLFKQLNVGFIITPKYIKGTCLKHSKTVNGEFTPLNIYTYNE